VRKQILLNNNKYKHDYFLSLMGKYYTMKQKPRKDREYEIHGDIIVPLHGDYFTEEGINGAIKALRIIARQKGINRKLYFEKNSEKKKRNYLREE